MANRLLASQANGESIQQKLDVAKLSAQIINEYEAHANGVAPEQTVRYDTSSPVSISLAARPIAWLCQNR
jgi:hypothetical protein